MKSEFQAEVKSTSGDWVAYVVIKKKKYKYICKYNKNVIKYNFVILIFLKEGEKHMKKSKLL